MRIALIATSLILTIGAASAADTCKASATEKKLAGAALTSFMKKCESDAAKTCDTSAAEKKLNGAAKTSFTKKCVTDAVGA
ncbi:PsiF family protein [Terrarubrum flagellatum]|uniref:PsiF family protein n=1 Tax=Terrirubrum flagellatum TaxID=2895980 RepID=UPI0031456C48